MTTQLMEPPVAAKKIRSPGSETQSVKLHIDVVESARIVSAYRNNAITDLLSDILRPILAKMEREEAAKRAKKGMGDK